MADRTYRVRDFNPTVNPPESIEEIAERLMAVERHLLSQAGRPSDLRRRVDRIELALTQKGDLPDESGQLEPSGSAGRED